MTDKPLKARMAEAAMAAFPDGEVTVREYTPGHPKLAARRLVHPHVGVRILFTGEGGEKYAIAGMIPATSTDNDVAELMARLADDKRRTEVVMVPGRVF